MRDAKSPQCPPSSESAETLKGFFVNMGSNDLMDRNMVIEHDGL